ncbi:hypothetical protein BX600DRAFT_19704 [Xylariales sp. PMI_506]|nr:hypothetical protein BX600DRAFT_19704 [Xylariales sp. PMI_506]
MYILCLLNGCYPSIVSRNKHKSRAVPGHLGVGARVLFQRRASTRPFHPGGGARVGGKLVNVIILGSYIGSRDTSFWHASAFFSLLFSQYSDSPFPCAATPTWIVYIWGRLIKLEARLYRTAVILWKHSSFPVLSSLTGRPRSLTLSSIFKVLT